MPAVDALIISHGHYDHVDGLLGFPGGLCAVHAQGIAPVHRRKNNFCNRFNHNQDGSFSVFGSPLDRHKLAALNVEPVLSEVPIIAEGHAFTTGAVPRTGIEHVFPNTG